MTLATRPTPRDMPRTVPIGKVKTIGALAGRTYVEYGGNEYVVGRPVNLADVSAKTGELVIAEPVEKVFDGTTMRDIEHRRATRVPTGTYAALQRKAEAKAAAAAAKATPRPIDLLARHALFAAQPERILSFPGGPERDPLPDHAIDPDVGTAMLELRTPAKVRISPSKAAPRTPAEYRARVEAEGIVLTVTDGALLDRRKPGGLSFAEESAIAEAEPFLLAALTGAPAPLCELAHRLDRAPAASVIGGGILACEGHLTGELQP